MEYRAIDQSNNLQHWKYIKRYKGSNGKWRYVYDYKITGRGYKRDEAFENAKISSIDRDLSRTYEKARPYNIGEYSDKDSNSVSIEKQRLNAQASKLVSDKNKSTLSSMEAKKNYETKSLVGATSTKITKAKKWLSNFVNLQTTYKR